jgi:hypothetical protein
MKELRNVLFHVRCYYYYYYYVPALALALVRDRSIE